MDAEPPYGGSDLGKIRCGPMPPLVLPLSPCLFGDRCASAPLAGHEAVCFLSGQAHPSGAAQGEDIRIPPSPSSPVLAFPDVVLGVGLPSWRVTRGRFQSGRTHTSRDLEVVGMANNRPPLPLDLSDGVRETIDSARVISTRKLYSSKWRVFKSWCLDSAVDPLNCPVGSVLEFSAGAAATTLRVYVAAIAA